MKAHLRLVQPKPAPFMRRLDRALVTIDRAAMRFIKTNPRASRALYVAALLLLAAWYLFQAHSHAAPHHIVRVMT